MLFPSHHAKLCFWKTNSCHLCLSSTVEKVSGDLFETCLTMLCPCTTHKYCVCYFVNIQTVLAGEQNPTRCGLLSPNVRAAVIVRWHFRITGTLLSVDVCCFFFKRFRAKVLIGQGLWYVQLFPQIMLFCPQNVYIFVTTDMKNVTEFNLCCCHQHFWWQWCLEF